MSTRNFVVKNGLTVGNVTIDAATGNLITINAALGNLATANYFSGDGGRLSNINGANITGNISGNITNANFAAYAGNVTVAAQPNITSVGTLTSLAVTGNVTAGGVKTDNLYYANGSPWDLQEAAGSNNQIQYNINNNFAASANFTFNPSTNLLTVVGNIAGTNVNAGNLLTANYVQGTLTTAAQPNITSVGTLTSLGVTGNVSAGNVSATGVTATTLGGTLTTAAQPNVTSVGTLTSLAVTGNIGAGNVNGGNLVSANYVSGTLTTAAQPNVTSVGTLTSLNVSGNANVGNIGAAAGVFTANVSANNLSTTNKIVAGNGLQVTTGALTVLGGNLDVTGNLNVTGNVNYSNVTDLVVGDPLIYMGADNTGDAVDLGIVASYNNGTYQHTGLARNASTDYWTFFDGVTAEPTTVIDWANATYPTVKMGNLITTGGANITGNANVGNIGATDGVFTGNISATLVTGTLATAAQPNVTSVGSLTGLTMAANADIVLSGAASEVKGANLVSATYLTGTLTTAAQPNVTSVGTLTSLSVTGNVSAGNVSATGVTATTVGGTLTTAAQPNITSVGTLTALSVTGNVSAGNVSATGVTATTVGGTLTTAAQPNVTSVGTLTSLNVSGNANVGNLGVTKVVATGNVEANYFIGNGAFLTGIDTTLISNGTANVRTFQNANVTISAAGNANIVTVTGTGANVAGTLAVTGNISGNVFSGNGSGLSAIAGANVTGTVANATNATTAGTVTTAAQPNITSVGTLTSLAVTGNVTAGNVAGGNLVSANYVSGTLTTAAQPNITSVGNLTSLNVAGNLTGDLVKLSVGLSTDRSNVSVTTDTVIDEFAPSAFRTAKYIISASGTHGYQSVETLLVHDNTTAYITIYGSVCSNVSADIIELSSNINGVTGNVTVYASSNSPSAIVNVVASYIKT